MPYGESSRKYRRTVFTHDDWLAHRAEGRSFVNLKGIFFSGIVRQLKREVLLVSSMALAVVVWNSYLGPIRSDASACCLIYRCRHYHLHYPVQHWVCCWYFEQIHPMQDGWKQESSGETLLLNLAISFEWRQLL